MKKVNFLSLSAIFSVVLSSLLIGPACTTTKKEAPPAKTVLGAFTPYAFFRETLNGKVKTVKEINYWVSDNAGSITAGDRITIADRDTFNWTNDIEVSFDNMGNIEKCVFLNEKDEPFGEWDISLKDGKCTKASWIAKDTIRNYVDISYPDENSIEMKRYDAATDSLRGTSKIKLDPNGKLLSIAFFNSMDEPQNHFNYKYDPNGALANYTVMRDDTVRGGMNFQQNEEGFTQSQEVFGTSKDDHESYVYNYIYDDMGNWISYIGYKDGQPIVVCKRTYTYYSE